MLSDLTLALEKKCFRNGKEVLPVLGPEFSISWRRLTDFFIEGTVDHFAHLIG